jgi:transcriptional antiterminator NusG
MEESLLVDEVEVEVGTEEEKPEPDGRAWYVVHSYTGYENKVKTNL